MKNSLYLFLFLSLFIASCSDDDAAATKSLTLSISNLSNLGSSEVYEGWVIVNGSPVSTGTFTVDDNGNLSQSSFDIATSDLENATDFVLSIEPVPDTDAGPSSIKLLGGGFTGNTASISVNHGASLNTTLEAVAGKYILATPTTTTLDDELSGIWFLDITSGSPEAGLSLPALPSGWLYEGWVVMNGVPVSTGTFSTSEGADMSALFSGSDAGAPPFPGEDFVTNAPTGLSFPSDLSSTTAVISIEPNPDNSPMPFALKPLVGQVPSGAADHFVYDLSNQVSATFPSGTVTRVN